MKRDDHEIDRKAFLKACGYEELSEEEKLDLWREFQEDYLKHRRIGRPRAGAAREKNSGEGSGDRETGKSSGDK